MPDLDRLDLISTGSITAVIERSRGIKQKNPGSHCRGSSVSSLTKD